MELRHLRYFVEAALEENVSKAALKLHVSQPALSRQIRDLEDELGFDLFSRGAKSLALTDAGRTFLDEASAVLERLETGISRARAASRGELGVLEIGYAPSLTIRMLPSLLKAFQKLRPNCRVKLRDWTTEEMLAGLRSAELHLAILAKPRRAALRGLGFHAMARDPVRLAVSPTHELAGRKRVAVEDLVDVPLVGYARNEYPEYHDMVEKAFASLKSRPRIVEEHDSVTSLVASIEAEVSVALVTDSMGCMAGPRLVLLPLRPEPSPLEIGIAWQEGSLSPSATDFLELARRSAD